MHAAKIRAADNTVILFFIFPPLFYFEAQQKKRLPRLNLDRVPEHGSRGVPSFGRHTLSAKRAVHEAACFAPETDCFWTVKDFRFNRKYPRALRAVPKTNEICGGFFPLHFELYSQQKLIFKIPLDKPRIKI